MPNPQNMRPVLLIHKRDGHVVARYPSITAAAACTRNSTGAIVRHVRREAMSSGDYILRYEDRWTGREEFESSKSNRPVIAMSGTKLTWFSDIKHAAKALNVTYNAMNGLVHRGGGRDGIKFRFATGTDDWPRLREAAGKIGEER